MDRAKERVISVANLPDKYVIKDSSEYIKHFHQNYENIKTMTKLQKKYELETGEKVMYRKNSSDYHTLRYVIWLEDYVVKLEEEQTLARLKKYREKIAEEARIHYQEILDEREGE